MKNKLVIGLFSLACILLSISCEKEIRQLDPRDEIISLSSKNEEVTFTNYNKVANVSFNPLGGVINITVATTYEWDYEISNELDTWCKVEKLGTGLQFEVSSYFEDNLKEGQIILKSEGNEIAYINVKQLLLSNKSL